jgi:hypothetical protein
MALDSQLCGDVDFGAGMAWVADRPDNSLRLSGLGKMQHYFVKPSPTLCSQGRGVEEG